MFKGIPNVILKWIIRNLLLFSFTFNGVSFIQLKWIIKFDFFVSFIWKGISSQLEAD